MTDGRTERSEQTRAAILDAARGLFAQRGLDGTSVRDIAEAASVTKSLIHHHFGSKEALYEAACAASFEGYWTQQKELFASMEPSEELLVRSMRTFFRFHRENPEFVQLTAHQLAREIASPGSFTCPGDARGELGAELVHDGVARIRMAMERGGVRQDLDPRWMLITLLNATRSWSILRSEWRSFFPELDDDALDEAYLDHMLAIVIPGMRPGAARPPVG